MASVGLALSDLFDNPIEHGNPIPKRDRWNARALVKQLAPELAVVLIASHQISSGNPLSAVDQRRLCDAHERLLNAMRLVT